MSLLTADYDYELPAELIARYPTEQRQESRLLLVDRKTESLSDHRFADFPDLIATDCLTVLNNTRVIPARLKFRSRNAELLLLEQIDIRTWRALVRPGQFFRRGRQFSDVGFAGRVIEIEMDGTRKIEFAGPLDLDRVGELPLPPYLGRDPEPLDRERYQTTYGSRPGAIAAPTAGLHFTTQLINQLNHCFITLHVGVGTFRPVKAAVVSEHAMHSERYDISVDSAQRIDSASHVLAVGTTTVRALEATVQQFGAVVPGRYNTDIFIYPGFRFQRVNSLLTNFHLPRSTLLMLVAAFAGREFILEAYRRAVKERYRFFSYGDCMLIR
jgi:S-adenosylmethionine:tRNA ribosyltransferase-isomerase